MLQPFTVFTSHVHVQYLYVCVGVVLSATCSCDNILFVWLANISHRNSPCQRDLWLCGIIKLQLSTVENPIPFLLILLMYWYIFQGCFSVDSKAQHEAGSDVKDCCSFSCLLLCLYWILSFFNIYSTAVLKLNSWSKGCLSSAGASKDANTDVFVYMCLCVLHVE